MSPHLQSSLLNFSASLGLRNSPASPTVANQNGPPFTQLLYFPDQEAASQRELRFGKVVFIRWRLLTTIMSGYMLERLRYEGLP